MILFENLQKEIKIGDKVKFCYEELNLFVIKKHSGVWKFDGWVDCPINCSMFTCKGKMKFSNDGQSVVECIVYNVMNDQYSPIVLLKNQMLDDSLFEI